VDSVLATFCAFVFVNHLHHTQMWFEVGFHALCCSPRRKVESSRLQISIDLFACPTQYVDLATLSSLPRFSSGTVNFYPSFGPASPRAL
jgi:hypothetical protein